VNDALGAALASADDLISGRQVFRNDLQRRVLDTGIGKAFLDRFQDVCAHRRRASRSPSTAAYEKSDRDRRRARAPGAAGTECDRSSLRRVRRSRDHRSDKGSKARVTHSRVSYQQPACPKAGLRHLGATLLGLLQAEPRRLRKGVTINCG